jgi:hypothetical protein
VARLDTGRGRSPQRTRLAVVADDDHDATIDAALCARVEDRLKRRTFVARALRFAAFTSYATSGERVVPSIVRGLEVVDGLEVSCHRLGGDDGVRNTRISRPYGGLSGEMIFGWVTGIRTDRPRVVGSDFMNLSRLSAIGPE